jgi:hypothetical protein
MPYKKAETTLKGIVRKKSPLQEVKSATQRQAIAHPGARVDGYYSRDKGPNQADSQFGGSVDLSKDELVNFGNALTTQKGGWTLAEFSPENKKRYATVSLDMDQSSF